MNLISKLFNMLSQPRHQPEDDYVVTVTDTLVKIEHPKWEFGLVRWKDLHTIILLNTDKGPWQPDVWLTLIDNNGRCMIPQGANGYDEVYDIVSKYEGFNFENVIQSMASTENAQFLLWQKPFQVPQPDETLITGAWYYIEGVVIADYNCNRIDWLTKQYLLKTEVKDEGWTAVYQDLQDKRYWVKTFPHGEMQGGGPPLLYCIGSNSDYLYGGMTVNERLHISGQLGTFDTAVKQNDVVAVISILHSVELTDESIASILDNYGLKKPLSFNFKR